MKLFPPEWISDLQLQQGVSCGQRGIGRVDRFARPEPELYGPRPPQTAAHLLRGDYASGWRGLTDGFAAIM